MWNLDGLDFDQGESFSILWNLVDFEETRTNDSSFRNSEDSVTYGASRNDEVVEPLPKQRRLLENQLEHEEEPFQKFEEHASDNDSHIGLLADDGMEPGPSGMGANRNAYQTNEASENDSVSDDSMLPGPSRVVTNKNADQYSNDNFIVDVKRIGFKRITRFQYSDAHYQVHLAPKPGKSSLLLHDALDDVLHSIARVLEDLKSDLIGGTDRTLYLVSCYPISNHQKDKKRGHLTL